MTETEKERPKGFCEECGEPIYEKHEFIATFKEDHNPGTPGIPAETLHRETYKCPECGYCPVDEY